MLNILIQYKYLFLQGFFTTTSLLFIVSIISIPVGIGLAVYASKCSKETGNYLEKYLFFTKIVPFLVILYWLHYPVQSILNIVVNPYITSMVALCFVNIALVSNSVLKELKFLPQEYIDTARILGLNTKEIILNIEFPILSRRLIPQILFIQSKILEYTLFSSLISVEEIFRVAQEVNAMVYKPVEIYSLLVLFFIIILFPLHKYIESLERKYKNIKYA